MKLTLLLAVSLPLITCRAATSTTVTLYSVSTGTGRLISPSETFKPLGVGPDGMTTYRDRVVASVVYTELPKAGGTTVTASDGAVITGEVPPRTITTTLSTPVTMDGTLVADASHLVYHKDPDPANTLEPGGNKMSCDFNRGGSGTCVKEVWTGGLQTATTTFSGPAVPHYTLVVDLGQINGASWRVVVGWGVAMVGILFGAFQVL
ncbi:hypothetical protein LshimejAT787_2100220 [Lyophyllum shimeji]|uniref:Uncharacterized protein n=1 Tax=Lyophyllum shimeji TaxID=47721 RepID=A0A9P3PY91_LYOSH|nr:hypothetical protein LshimejAT787_2100220 [Lyophyllum shimeji]